MDQGGNNNGRESCNNNNSNGGNPNKPKPLSLMGAIPKKPRPPPPPQSQQQQQRPQGMPLPNHRSSPTIPPRSLTAAIPRRQGSSGMKHAPPSLSSEIPRRNSVDKMGEIPRRNSIERPQHRSQPPRQQQQPQQQHQQSSPPQPPRRSLPLSKRAIRTPTKLITVTAEDPFLIQIPLKGVPLIEGLPRFRASSRTPKRKRPTYQELQDTDSDDFVTDSGDDDDDDANASAKAGSKTSSLKKKDKKKKLAKPAVASVDPLAPVDLATDLEDDVAPPPATGLPNLKNTSLDAPPPGTLNTLWYSRELFLHVFVMEKILAWKTRASTQLEWVLENFPQGETPPTPLPTIDAADAAKLSVAAITNPIIWRDPLKRMEVSRLLPEHCPIVLAMAAAKEFKDTEGKPKFRIKHVEDSISNVSLHREDVYLVKWRGRSHMHAAWERGSDIIKYDQSNNTARHKIRRFVQSQEVDLGLGWKEVLEEERTTAAAIHAHGSVPTEADDETHQVEEFFAPAYSEVERILACDESEMDLSLYAKQRALNIKVEQKEVVQRELPPDKVKRWNSQQELEELIEPLPWDPEDNVRYVVKWKGLPFSEITWEYWRDIKREAVNDAEDFWVRQQPPSQEVIAATIRPHPRIQDFRKMHESPEYGTSTRERPIADLGEKKEEEEEDDVPKQGFKLRSYQLEGVNWLLFNWWNKRSCILADEMGLGKTIQSMCFIKSLQDSPETGVRGPFLIVAPLSLIGQWQSEAKSWTPDLNVVLYHGSADARDFLVKQEFFFTDQFVPKATAIKLKKQHVTKFHILITTYEVVLKDINVLSKIKWRTLIVDEAHRLKNSKSRLFDDLLTVPRDYCVLLTGTPLANATEELWALLHFANPTVFEDKDDFLEKFGVMTDTEQVNALHTLLKPYLLRRVKEDVEKSLPPKEETILEVSLTPIQKKYYKAIYERNTAFLFKGSKPSNSPSLMNVMMELRKCCNHPFLVRGAEERIIADAAANLKKGEDGEDLPIDQYKLFGDQLVKSSGKMVLIAKLLPKLFANGHKVLIFSQMVRVLDLLEELIRIMKYKYERLDGSTSSSSRAAAVDRFVRKSCQRFVMLLSTRAGGLGLNLTAADVVIIFDSDWNPQNDLQAMARAHRIGQTRAVRVYRLLTAKTYEVHMFHSASMKLGLERAILSQQREQTEEGEDGKMKPKTDKEAQAKEIDELLKKGAYDVFRDEDDEEGKKFMETDIDQLLERNTKTVTYDAKDNNSGGMGNFSKASFVADTGDGEKDVDLDDPDFWSKAVGLEAPVETPEEIAQMLDDGVKRSRKQVQQFDPYAEFAEAEQRKQDKIAMKVKAEKEEKDRIRFEKRKKKKDEKERKRREREELRGSLFGKKSAPIIEEEEEEEEPKPKKQTKESKPKKPKKGVDRKRLLKRAQNADPVLERLKQAWDTPQRNRAIAASLRFGFTRFCKIRNESNLTSLCIQDLEAFFRSYFYQLSLQVAVTFLAKLRNHNHTFNEESLNVFLKECLGPKSSKEVEWMCNCISSGMKFYLEVDANRRFLRMPMTLAEPSFLAELRRGPALRALRRLFLLGRVERVIEDCLDDILSVLGYEELGKRGCQTSDISAMDVDLKARMVTSEELSLSVGSYVQKVRHRAPIAWWDRSCDVALLIGTFVHGLGNYEVMQNDYALPFSVKIRKFAESDEACGAAQLGFYHATAATRKVFDDALESAKAKAQAEVHAAVAAAAAESANREKDALALREGGAAADKVLSSMPEPPTEKPYEFDGDDSHFVTLPRLKHALSLSLREDRSGSDSAIDMAMPTEVTMAEGDGDKEEGGDKRKAGAQKFLSMPDSRVLDFRLSLLLSEIEQNVYPDEITDMDTGFSPCTVWPKSNIVSTNIDIRSRALSHVSGLAPDALEDDLSEYMGIGVSGNQCGAAHRSLDDGTDFSIGAASHHLSQVAYGPDAPRYLRAIGIPMNFTRFAISALVNAEERCVEHLLADENVRSYGNADGPIDDSANTKKESAEAASEKKDSADSASKKKDGAEAASEQKDSTKSTSEKKDGAGTASEKKESTESTSEKKHVAEAADEKKGSNESSSSEKKYDAESVSEKMDSTESSREKKDGAESTDEKKESTESTSGMSTYVKKHATSESVKIEEDSEKRETSKKQEPETASTRSSAAVSQQDETKKPAMPKVFEESAALRASVCVTVLHYGFPFMEDADLKVQKPLWCGIREQCGLFDDIPPNNLYGAERFRSLLEVFAQSVEVPGVNIVKEYVETCLLPHCLRLCLMGNGASTRSARGSKGEYDTAFGTSVYPEHANDLQSPLPDPCLPLGQQSLEAIANAHAILRRVRIMKSALDIASGKVTMDDLDEVLRSSYMRKSMEGLPVWWCPWIHDVALLVHASTRGLFSILNDRHSEEKGNVAFSKKTIAQHMYSTFIAEDNLPRSIVHDSPPEDVTAWIEMHAMEFPSANVLERRLAFLCAKATENVDGEVRYDNLPMFDHGAWPRN